MNRTQTRISRALVGLLVLTLVVAGATYLGKSSKPQQKKTDPLASTADKPATPPVMQAIQTTQPTTAPAPMTAMSAVPASAISVTPTVSSAPPATQPQVAAVAVKPAPAIVASATIPPSDKPPTWTPTASAVPAAPSADFLAVAATKVTSGDLLGARRVLNDALLWGKLSDADTTAARKQLAEVNDTIIFSPRRFQDDDYGGTHVVQPGQRLTKIAESYDVPWELIAKINGLSDPRKMRSGQKLKIVKGPFNIVVHKKTFTMDLYLGSTPGEPGSLYVKSYPVGLGRDDSTPQGTWLVDSGHKTKDPVYYSPRGEGVIAANDPKNPLGHRWIGLTGVDGSAVGQQSYGIHGTIDPDSIGKQASMGCIRMHNEDVEQVYDMVTEGKTTVIVKD